MTVTYEFKAVPAIAPARTISIFTLTVSLTILGMQSNFNNQKSQLVNQ